MDDEACYEMIDRFLRNNLGDDDYEEYLEALDQLCQPTPRTWVGLTDEEVAKCYADSAEKYNNNFSKEFYKNIEAKLKEKNT